MLRVTPIYGSRFDAKGAADTPSCTLVEYGNVSVLVNVGWDESCSGEFPELPPHHVLVLTDSTLGAMGALPQYHKQNPDIPMYATFPTVKMGQMTLYDYHASISLDGGKPPYSLEELDNAFASLKTLKYSQSVTIHDPSTLKPALAIMAHRAGFVVGAAFYVLQRLQDETFVVVTSDYHIAKEIHLDSSTLLKHGSTPDVLVTRPGGPAMGMLSKLYGGLKPLIPTPVVHQAEKTLMETIMAVLRRDGNVLIPVDASGRILEYLLLLSQHWDRQRLAGAYNLCWMAPMAQNTLDYARSQLEWMAAPLGSQFDSQRGHPFQLSNVNVCCSLPELNQVLENGSPTCVMASGESLDRGPARDLLLKWADNPDNAIILPDSSRCTLRANKNQLQEPLILPGGEEEDATEIVGSALSPDSKLSEYSTAAQLLSHWCRAKLEEREMDDVIQVDILVPSRAPLAGNELKTFLAEEEEARQLKLAQEEEKAELEQLELAKGELRLGEDDTMVAESLAAKKTPTPTARSRPKKKSRFDSTMFLKFSKPLHLTFDVREEAVGVSQADLAEKQGVGESARRSKEIVEDDYGIAVDPDHFKDIISGVDPSKMGAGGRVGDNVRRIGFGFGMQGRPGSNSAGAATPGKRIARDDEEEEVDDTPDEMELEALDLSEGKGIIRGRGGRPPMKVTTVPRLLEVLAEVTYVPLEGRVSSRAARQSVRALQPGKVVILGGAAGNQDTESALDEVMLLADSVRSYITDKNSVLTPSNGDTAELDVGHAAYSVRLIDTPYISPEEQVKREEDDEPLVPVEPFEAQLGEYTVSLFDFFATGRKVASDGSIVLAPRPFSKEIQKKQPNIIVSNGEVLLTDLRAQLIAEGMKADYSTRPGYAQLVVNGKVIVKKDQESGKIDIEGPLCEDFYKIRSIVCGQFVTL